MGCSPSNQKKKAWSEGLYNKTPAYNVPKALILPPIGHHVSRKSDTETESTAREKSSERKQNRNHLDNRKVVTKTFHAKADEAKTTSTGHIYTGNTSGRSETLSTQETKEGSTLPARLEHFPSQKTEAHDKEWLKGSSGLENRKTNDQTRLFSKQETKDGKPSDQTELICKKETKDGSTLPARLEHFPSQKTEAHDKEWLKGSSGLENRKTNDQTRLFSKQETKDGQTLVLTDGDNTKKSKKGKKKNRRKLNETNLTDSKEAKHHNAAERNENHYASSSYDMIAFQENQWNTNRLERLVSQLKEEKAVLLNRLSAVGAIQLTENNPNVTDLSDANRPEKLMEQFSELYDNEWTDAYEYLTKTRNESMKGSVERLLQVLQKTFKVCISSTENKKETLRNAIIDYVGLSKQEQDEIEFKDVEKTLREYRMKKFTNNFKKIEQEVGDQLKGIFTTETFVKVSEYIGSCIRICWKMSIKEPPMYLDFGDSKEPAQSSSKTTTKMPFDKEKFMSYTKSGNYIDYVVWPAVYLYKDGPRMKKGVAQGTDDEEEYEDGTNTPT